VWSSDGAAGPRSPVRIRVTGSRSDGARPGPAKGYDPWRTRIAKTEVYYFSGTGNSLVLAKLVGRDDSQLGM